MNVIFLTLSRISDIEDPSIYSDLMRKFRDEGHKVYIVTPAERRLKQETSLKESHGVMILNVRTLNVQKTNIVEKGIGTLLVETQFKGAIKKYLKDIKFDLITYSTPPITFTNVVKYLKRKNPQAVSYLQLKDIFPQNAVDIGMMSTTGVKGLLYKFFRKKEKALYAVSDFIGCMSPANVKFILEHNPALDVNRVEVAPNSIELKTKACDTINTDREDIRIKYGLPVDKPIFIYGGNLGKPQGIDFLIQCLDANRERKDCYFVVVGSGTEYGKLESWIRGLQLRDKELNVKVIKGLPKVDYDMLVRSCDIGMIFLDHRFTIPNYPSRLLSYLENKMPVICATDPNCDMGRIAEENGYGYWCESNSVEAFTTILDRIIQADRQSMGEKGYQYLCENYTVENTFSTIISHIVIDN
jgi:glycosyltransferase involved in cell wall biosynthesis